MPSRRAFIAGSAASAAALSLSSCADADEQRYLATAADTRAPLGPDPDLRSFIRYATLAPNGHNAQPWRFSPTLRGVAILPDFARRTPAVDPDDHHLFVSLGAAAETLLIAAAAGGRPGAMRFDTADGRIAIDLSAGRTGDAELCRAIPARQSTRSAYDGKLIPLEHLRLLERAASREGVSLLLVTAPVQRELVLAHALLATDRQMDDAAFIDELRGWVRFNADDALATRDGLYAASSGNITVPTWLGSRMFPHVFTKASEARRCIAYMRSSSAIAVFIGDKADADHWVRVGRSFQRFALQATALGLRHAHINQPVEVPSVRSDFARALGFGDVRPDLVVRLGYAPPLPMSLRREATLALPPQH